MEPTFLQNAWFLLIGFLIAVAKSALGMGRYVFACWPGLALTACGAYSIAAGVLLAVLASFYRSWAASRMAPMEAMRVDSTRL